jgi:hypothetical protein
MSNYSLHPIKEEENEILWINKKYYFYNIRKIFISNLIIIINILYNYGKYRKRIDFY